MDAPMRIDPFRAAFALLGAWYVSTSLRDPHAFLLLDHVDLAIHEAGHVLFAILGETMGMAGGTLLQLIVPAAFVVHFARQEQQYSAAIVLLWGAQSLFNVAVYAADARAQELPLVGGDGATHDWNYLLTAVGWLEHDTAIAGAIRGIGVLLCVCALAAAIALSGRPQKRRVPA